MEPKKKDLFFNFLGIDIHNFVKNDQKFQSKRFPHAKFCGTWHKKNFRSQGYDIYGLELKN